MVLILKLIKELAERELALEFGIHFQQKLPITYKQRLN